MWKSCNKQLLNNHGCLLLILIIEYYILLPIFASFILFFPQLTQRRQHKESNRNLHSVTQDQQALKVRQDCLEEFAEWFGYMPLVHSSMRLDTMLFKDPVSNMRKKYRQIELVNS